MAVDELESLGISAQEDPAGALFAVAPDRLAGLLRVLRVPSRLLLRVAQGRADQLSDVQNLLQRVPWFALPQPLPPLQVRLSSEQARPAKAKWILEELLRQLRASGRTLVQDAPEEGDAGGLQIVARYVKDTLQLSIDVAGRPMHHRGWRLQAGPAPMRETLAQAILRLAQYNPLEPLWDPMTGSGTLAIEAATWLRPLPMELQTFSVDSWNIAHKAWPTAPGLAHAAIVAGDQDAVVLAMAVANAGRAGVAEEIDFQAREILQQIPTIANTGLVVANPPWGQRLGGRNAARRLYERLGAVLARRVPGWRAAILVPERNLAQELPIINCTWDRLQAGGLAVWLVRGTIAAQAKGGHR